MTVKHFSAGVVIRGEWLENDLIEFGGRSVGIAFLSPNPLSYVSRLPLGSPNGLNDLYSLSFQDILDYIDRLGTRLTLKSNSYLQQALEASILTSSQTPPLLEKAYESFPNVFNRAIATEIAESAIGVDHLEGWVTNTLHDGRKVGIRAFGSRALHIIAGNSPLVAAATIIRNFITRGDAIIKSPSNDPFTALAIARTMVEMDPTHPLTKHLSVAYWKGGDEEFEQRLYRPVNIEKIIAWGGFASVKHVAKYVQPGLALVTLDPKRSISIVGSEAFEDEQRMRDAALRLATDIGSVNQEGCVNARVVYVMSGTDEAGLAKLDKLGLYTYEALMNLPSSVSTVPKGIDRELRALVEAARLNEESFNVIGGTRNEGAIIVSRVAEPVDFSQQLAKRVANLVPIDDIEEVYPAVDAYTQTAGVYPDSLKDRLRDSLAIYGVQRLTSLGYAASMPFSIPQDGIEPTRQMCKWIVCENCDPAITPPLWEDGEMHKVNVVRSA